MDGSAELVDDIGQLLQLGVDGFEVFGAEVASGGLDGLEHLFSHLLADLAAVLVEGGLCVVDGAVELVSGVDCFLG